MIFWGLTKINDNAMFLENLPGFVPGKTEQTVIILANTGIIQPTITRELDCFTHSTFAKTAGVGPDCFTLSGLVKMLESIILCLNSRLK